MRCNSHTISSRMRPKCNERLAGQRRCRASCGGGVRAPCAQRASRISQAESGACRPWATVVSATTQAAPMRSTLETAPARVRADRPGDRTASLPCQAGSRIRQPELRARPSEQKARRAEPGAVTLLKICPDAEQNARPLLKFCPIAERKALALMKFCPTPELRALAMVKFCPAPELRGLAMVKICPTAKPGALPAAEQTPWPLQKKRPPGGGRGGYSGGFSPSQAPTPPAAGE